MVFNLATILSFPNVSYIVKSTYIIPRMEEAIFSTLAFYRITSKGPVVQEV